MAESAIDGEIQSTTYQRLYKMIFGCRAQPDSIPLSKKEMGVNNLKIRLTPPFAVALYLELLSFRRCFSLEVEGD